MSISILNMSEVSTDILGTKASDKHETSHLEILLNAFNSRIILIDLHYDSTALKT